MASAIAAVTLRGAASRCGSASLGLPWLDRDRGRAGGRGRHAHHHVRHARLRRARAEAARPADGRDASPSAVSRAGRVARRIAMAPVVWVLARSTDVVAPPARRAAARAASPGVTEEEIKLLVTEQGTLLDEEKRMIHEVFELGDTVAREIMVPRVDTEMLEDTHHASARRCRVFQKTGFSRMPVYHEDPDSRRRRSRCSRTSSAPSRRADADEPLAEHMRDAVLRPGDQADPRPALRDAGDAQPHGGRRRRARRHGRYRHHRGHRRGGRRRDRRRVRPRAPLHQRRSVRRRWIVDGRLSAEDAREKLGARHPGVRGVRDARRLGAHGARAHPAVRRDG